MAAQPAAEIRYRGAWRWGLLFGILQVALQYGTDLLLGYFMPGASALVRNLVDIVLFGLSLLLYGCAGYIAARRSQNPSSGNSAGLYADLVYASIGTIIALLLFSTTSEPYRQFIGQCPIAIVSHIWLRDWGLWHLGTRCRDHWGEAGTTRHGTDRLTDRLVGVRWVYGDVLGLTPQP